MHDVLEALSSASNTGRKVVFTSLVETRGSTPQKAGAAMLVFENGDQIGTLGGGCVEAEVKRKALENLAHGKAELVQFTLDHDYGWDDGLICGGRMTMLICPVVSDQTHKYYDTYLKQLQSGNGCTEAVLLDSTYGSEGTRFLIDRKGNVVSSAGSEIEIPPPILEELIPLESRPRPYIRHGISFLPYLSRARLVIIGAGHVGRQLSHYATDVDFDVTIVDDRELYCNKDNIPSAKEWIVGDFDEILPSLNIDSETFCVIVTRGHNHDETALFHLVKRSPRYLGMIGSKRKIRLIYDDLLQNGIPPASLDCVFAPIGLEIGSQTVPEIAISIVAQLIANRNQYEKHNIDSNRHNGI